MGIIKFLFYIIYLLAAELPVLLILFLRSWEELQIHMVIKFLTISSIIVNLIFCIVILCYKKDSTMRNQIIEITPNNASISDFFSFFLLPFFTFSFSSNLNSNRFFVELGILFVLLSILLFKTKNLSSNIIFYILFNNFDVRTDSKNNIRFLVLNDLNFEEFSEGKSPTIKIAKNLYIYYGTKKKLFFNFILAIIILISILLFVIYSNKIL
ncbi:hypothetical protein ACIQ4I_12150 [Rummeliibacillus sp. NPDC094406]|uniref:hypothetical protein n=1 Tax=Rummeliibacillus sp. NPDC094406 TaxID=3364511 RepID=UPI00380AF34F